MPRQSPSKARPDPFRDEFHRLLGQLVHAIARFDFTVGLQLNWLGPYCQKDVTELLSPRQAKLGEHLKKLKALIMDVYEPAGPKALAEFTEWFARADQARVLRNDYCAARNTGPDPVGLGGDSFDCIDPATSMVDVSGLPLPSLAALPLREDHENGRADGWNRCHAGCSRTRLEAKLRGDRRGVDHVFS